MHICIGYLPYNQAIGLAVYPLAIEVNGEYAAARSFIYPGCSGRESVAYHPQPVVRGQLMI
jgi:hypothetical protein